jgi:hypothetical protein
MTRRGSLAYYFAAIVCGSFFVALAYYARAAAESGLGPRWAYNFLFAYFLALIAGFLPQLLNAFVLRRVMRALGWRGAWHWVAVGAVVGVALLWGVARLGFLIEGMYFPADWQRVKLLLAFPLLGPIMFAATPFWLPLPAFAATAWVLHRIHRAFEPADTPPAESSPAPEEGSKM